MNECAHVWLTNSGRGGPPEFRPNRQMSANPLMHVRCSECNARTWFTEQQWAALPVGEIVNPHVQEHVKEPEPDFEAMNRTLDRENTGE